MWFEIRNPADNQEISIVNTLPCMVGRTRYKSWSHAFFNHSSVMGRTSAARGAAPEKEAVARLPICNSPSSRAGFSYVIKFSTTSDRLVVSATTTRFSFLYSVTLRRPLRPAPSGWEGCDCPRCRPLLRQGSSNCFW